MAASWYLVPPVRQHLRPGNHRLAPRIWLGMDGSAPLSLLSSHSSELTPMPGWQVVRRSLKEGPAKTKAMSRDNTNMKITSFENSKKTATRETLSLPVPCRGRRHIQPHTPRRSPPCPSHFSVRPRAPSLSPSAPLL